MSVVITVKFPVSADTMERVVTANADTMQAIAADGRRHGTIHHQFTADPDGNAVVIDEWPDEDSFHRFFDAQDDIKKVMAEAGVTGPPEVTVYRTLDTPDRF
ncbi:hypothetical protein LQ327_18935 [Actinomycetospora endophytica]|uniref:Quinol monooxygenase YgiN n=1 Tax=Actinomycetospora endophytica TaxID=2291215 RepID=A0ABS8PB19_9PSEU|nr:hypothetical protein [Actinomycetospora endophytica]MCD2195450.1 hypothetical protein [Actinomycetospora endophytica]